MVPLSTREQFDSPFGHIYYNLQTAGPPKETSTTLTSLIFENAEKIKSVWTVVVNKKGDDKKKQTSWIEVMEAELKDKSQHQFKITWV
ncbi:hypothetical protein N7536_002535 [Penicillium majusculum]|nr:hypothetical protein N7536_002535 [Penicillium majusculum]